MYYKHDFRLKSLQINSSHILNNKINLGKLLITNYNYDTNKYYYHYFVEFIQFSKYRY